MAAPGARVVNLQADGSACYSLPALWTQAREGLAVTTLICANRDYAILKVEMARQRVRLAAPAPANGGGASRVGGVARSLTHIGAPDIDFVALAAGFGVPGVRVSTTEELAAALRQALARPGPFLIEAVLA